jgi:hypothetical protein
MHQMIMKVVDTDQRNWDKVLPYVALAYNNATYSGILILRRIFLCTADMPIYRMIIQRTIPPMNIMQAMMIIRRKPMKDSIMHLILYVTN